MKIQTAKELKIGQYLQVDGQNIIHEGEVIGQVSEKLPVGRNLRVIVRTKTGDTYDVSVLRFADLHRHSGYSLLDGASKIEEIVEHTDYVGALTDHGNMYGYLKYYKAMKAAGKQPIVGFEAYSETIDGNKESHHLLILAKNYIGYKNLLKLTSLSYENFYRKPHISYDMLQRHKEGLIVTSACIGGEIPQMILQNDYEKAKEIALWFKDEFKDDFYLEIQRHGMGHEEDVVNASLQRMSAETGIKMVATTDSHYTLKEDKQNHELLLCMQTGKTLKDADRMIFPGSDYHIHTVEEMERKFQDIPEALDSTIEIAEKCSGFDLNLGELYLPKFNVPEGESTHTHFQKVVWEGFHSRFKETPMEKDPVYHNRLKYEIEVIAKMGYEAYFLIVADFIGYAKKNGIMVGPGRGSAVGSLVSYSMGIVDLDPIPYGLLFERFLNPERVSMPDIDVDFCYDRRDEVIDYVRNKYGEEAVSKIITFGTLGAKSVVRDVSRAMGNPYGVGDRIAKLIPATPGITLEMAMNQNPELSDMYRDESQVREIINVAMRLEGLPRHASVHACGVVISPSDVSDYLPETLMGEKGSKKERTSQVTMTEVEELGLLKMDFLSLRTMTLIGNTITSVNENEKKGLEYLNIPINDPYTYSDISKGKTFAVFQLESGGMREFMKELYSDVDLRIKQIEKKHKMKGFVDGVGRESFMIDMRTFGNELFERLIAGVSLYRPGPMEYIPNYINGMLRPEDNSYLTPELESILKTTYKTIVYQEQVMEIVQKLAGYSLGRADLVRRAMGKKKADVMAEEKQYFIHGKVNKSGEVEVEGCVRRGISQEIAEEIWMQMEDFSKYAFNKSHAAAYAMIAVKTAWLKLYFPVDFMTATLNSFINSGEKLKTYLSVCREMGIEILPPSVNLSNEMFSRKGKDIVFGLKGIRNVGKFSALIAEERKERGMFQDILDFTNRMVIHHKANKRAIEGLIYAGALDNFEGTRKGKISIVPDLLKIATNVKKKVVSGQISLFDEVKPSERTQSLLLAAPQVEEYEKKFKLAKEKEFAGFYVTEHPLYDYLKYFADGNVTEIGILTLTNEDGENEVREDMSGQRVRIAGIISEMKVFYTKKDAKPIYVFQLEGMSGEIKCVVFSDQIDANRSKLMEGKIVIISGVIKEDDFGIQVIVSDVEDIETIEKSKQEPKALIISLRNDSELKTLREEILANSLYGGKTPVYVVKDGQTYKTDKNLEISLSLRSKLDNKFEYRVV